MFRSIKYQNPLIREHLASQYAMGLLSQQVKKRLEAFMQHDPTFVQEVIAWQERLSPLNELVDEVPAPAELKQKVLDYINTPTVTSNSLWKQQIARWWQSLWLWQGITLAAFISLLAVSFNTASLSSTGSLSYLAVMHSQQSTTEAPLVISAYSKTEHAPSRIELRWNDRTPIPDLSKTSLWAIERETGSVIQLTKLTAGIKQINLTSKQWKTVKNSLELIIVNGDKASSQILLRGACLQLSNWAS